MVVNRSAEKAAQGKTDGRVNPDDNRRAPIRPGDGDRAKALAESVECRALIKRHEGFRRGVYLDTRGNHTAGWGHLLTSRDPHHESEQWRNMDYLDALFEEDYHAALAAVSSLSTTYQALDLRAQYVLMDMAFNLGHYRLSRFKKMWKAIDNFDYATAADEMLDSKWRKQVKNRAVELAEMMRSCSE